MSFLIFPRIFGNDLIKASVVFSRVSKHVRTQSANITSKEYRDPNVKKPAPWPYKTKQFTFFRGYFESTTTRFDENTKIIVVDGNIGAGKSSFSKELAEAFDMVYFPEPAMEQHFVTEYGYDLRKIDALLPPSYKCCDISTYYNNPHHQNVPKMQFRMFMYRLENYIDALAHVLNTGQGVVLERSVYGDFVFIETMHKFGYISDPALELYNDIKQNTLEELMRPHLIVYLDISPEVALERIKKRNDPAEVNSKVLTKEYLANIEFLYKQKYLKKMEKHAEVLIYDWSNYGDVETVVEDIERIDFDRFSPYESKMRDWTRENEWDWNERRRFYTNKKREILNYGLIYRPRVTELFHPGEEVQEFEELMNKIPGEKYAYEFNADAGDSIWFKTKPKSYWHAPKTRRQTS